MDPAARSEPVIGTQRNQSAAHDRARRHSANSRGFSLVEVMVAMVIGMLGIIVMMQMFSFFEAQKRTTTGGDDAISSGSIALYGLQRNIQQSGWGFTAAQVIGCVVTGKWGFDAANPSVPNGPTLTIPFAPVTIFRAGAANPLGFPNPDSNTDMLLVVTGNGNGTVEGDNIDSAGTTAYAVHTPTAFMVGDKVVAVPQASCGAALTLAHVTSIVSPTVNVSEQTTGFTVQGGDKLFNLGSAPTVRAYAIRNQNLTVCDYMTNDCATAANWTPIANNVVSLRAEYGRDTTAPMDGAVDVWAQTTPTNACGLARTLAVRLVLVARSSQPEKTLDWPALTTHVFPNPPAWMGNSLITLPDPDPSWPTWKDFRYKVFQTVVPLRNITNLGVVSGC